MCVLKFIVSEGEKIMIFYFTSDADKSSVETIQQAAELGLISNLISIVCRFIFQPLEEIAFNLFSKLKGQENQEEQAVDILVQYLAGMCGIGVCGIIFSQVCSYEFILLVYSQQWATPSAVRIMKAYCVYLLGMSMNKWTTRSMDCIDQGQHYRTKNIVRKSHHVMT